MKKAERLEILKSFIDNLEIERQEDFVKLFAERGYQVTQATISRDIQELGLIKKQLSSGNFSYAFPTENGQPMNLLATAITSVDIQGKFIKLEVLPGTSMGVKNLLLLNYTRQVFAILVDDDTVLIFSKGRQAAEELITDLRQTIHRLSS